MGQGTGGHGRGADLIGRVDELRTLTRALETARRGTSTAVVLVGEAGIGKSTLLERCASAAADFTVLSVRGSAVEQELTYVVLADLLAPLVPQVSALPARQAEVLRGALAIGPTVTATRFELAVAVLALLATASAERPVLLAVDDAQWVDESSLACLSFVARRLHAEPVAAVFAMRPSPADSRTAMLFDGIDQVAVGRLSTEDSSRLLATVRPDLRRDRHDEIVEQALGNPLALSILRGSATAETPSAAPLDEQLRGAFVHELRGLPEDARRALELVAVIGDGSPARVADGLAELGLDVASLDAAEELGLVRQGASEVAFSHPLVGAAVVAMAPRPRLRRLHTVAARTLDRSDSPSDVERRLWHLAAGAVREDEDLAQQMEDLAAAALERSSAASAVRLLERAAELSASPDRRAERLLKAAGHLAAAGFVSDGNRILDQARAATVDPARRAQIAHLQCRLGIWGGSPIRARDSLMRLAREAEQISPPGAARMYGHAALTSIALGDRSTARTAVDSADALVGAGQQPDLTVEAPAALFDLMCGDPARGRARLARCRDEIARVDPLLTEQVLLSVGLCHFMDDDVPGALALVERAISAARAASALGLLPFQLSRAAVMQIAAGRWANALADAGEAVELARASGWRTELGYAAICLARVEAVMGREADCRAHIELVLGGAQREDAESVAAHAGSVLGLLEMGRGAYAAAMPHLEVTAAFSRSGGIPDHALLPWAGDLLEVYVRTGAWALADELGTELEAELARHPRPRLDCALERCRGLRAVAYEDADAHLVRSAETARGGAGRFEEARSLLALGQLRRRRHHARDSRSPLTAALAAFEQLGATAWAAQARAELRASGAPLRESDACHEVHLTPQEVSVARLVADGLTNQQVADRMFLSARTVEFHLASVFRKLGVERRGQLARRLPDSVSAS